MYTESTDHKKHYQCELRLRFIQSNIEELENFSFEKNNTLPKEVRETISKLKTHLSLYFERYEKNPHKD